MSKTKARELRKNPTDAERKLWIYLQRRQIGGHKFRRQHILGPYIVDFICLEKRLIIEVDGGHHDEQIAHDVRRSHWLKSRGFRVIKFWNNQVLKEIESVQEVIAEALGVEDDTPHL
jgi:5-methyltetrahydrofolate--homocysteine methyltransferase